MIITCPNCQTNYQVADNAIGSAGRKVQCANCQTSWQATASVPERPREVAPLPEADSDKLFDSKTEAELDREFEEEARRELAAQMQQRPKPAPTPISDKPDPSAHNAETDSDSADNDAEEDEPETNELDAKLQSRRLRELQRRQRKLRSNLPMARIRRGFRMLGLVLLMTLLAGSVFFRQDIVRAFPDMGGLYAAIGLGVNVVGLDFVDVETLRTLRDGKEVMVITSQITNISDRNVVVPSVMVSLISAEGASLYQWTVRPQAQILAAGESVAFETQLQAAPAETATVRLIFAPNGEN